jgi:hypothetical protein
MMMEREEETIREKCSASVGVLALEIKVFLGGGGEEKEREIERGARSPKKYTSKYNPFEEAAD